MTTKPKREPNKVPTKLLKKYECSQIILGCNPFIGWSYRGKKVAQQYKEKFSRPEPIKEVIVHACGYGINAIMTTADARGARDLGESAWPHHHPVVRPLP